MNDELRSRIRARITVVGECWIWNGSISPTVRYGRIWVNGRSVLAHRASYLSFVGEIPDGMTLDHLCREPRCVNPEHLEAVSQRENVLRGIGPCAINAAKTHCKHGHEFTPENTLVVRTPYGCGRACRTCRDQRNHARYPVAA